MSHPTRDGLTIARRPAPDRGAIRLDLLGNPYGPSEHVFEALAAADGLHLPAGERETLLRSRLADLVRVPESAILLGNGIDELLSMAYLARRGRGPLVIFPPTDLSYGRRAEAFGLEVLALRRAPSFGLGLDAETAAELPAGSTAVVASPNDPTGTPLSAQEAVRLCRACDLVIVDERHIEYGGRTLVPLSREFDNLLVLRTFETWAGLGGLPLAFAIGSKPALAALAVHGREGGAAAGPVIAALATLDDLAHVRATTQRVRAERSRMYRVLRKLNMVRPYPSWANFVLVRVERGEPELFVRELERREIRIYRPPQPELTACLRISATTPEQTDALKRSLIEIAASL